jgi:hypothetical protein
MTKTLWCLVILSVVPTLACNSSSRQTDGNATAPSPPAAQQPTVVPDKTLPTAVEIGAVLKGGGIPLTYEITDTTGALDFLKGPDFGIASEAKTATNATDFDVTVFRSVDFRRQARARLDAADAKLHADETRSRLPNSVVYYVECGPILITLQPDADSPKKVSGEQASRVQAILKKHYKCD